MSTYKTPLRPDELYHYGVLGMKWGVRKDRKSSEERKTIKQKKKEEKTLKRIESKAKYRAARGAKFLYSDPRGQRILMSALANNEDLGQVLGSKKGRVTMMATHILNDYGTIETSKISVETKYGVKDFDVDWKDKANRKYTLANGYMIRS